MIIDQFRYIKTYTWLQYEAWGNKTKEIPPPPPPKGGRGAQQWITHVLCHSLPGIGCCCYSFCCRHGCITLADDTGYSFCEYSQLSVNGHFHKTDTSLRRTPVLVPAVFQSFYNRENSVQIHFSVGHCNVFDEYVERWDGILRVWFLYTTTKPFDIICQPIQSTCKGHFTTVFSHKYAKKEESLRESIEKL